MADLPLKRSPKTDESRYARIDNSVLQRGSLSFRARGLLAYVLSLPTNWEHSADRLAESTTREGRDAVGEALKELVKHGHAVRIVSRGKDGRVKTRWTFSETPEPGFQGSVEPRTGTGISGPGPGPGKPSPGEPGDGEPGDGNSGRYETTKEETTVRETTVGETKGEEKKAPAPAPDLLLTVMPTYASPHWSIEHGWRGIGDDARRRWKLAFPACEIDRQLAAMDVWLRANPEKARKSRWEQFVSNWLSRSQERGGDLSPVPRTTGIEKSSASEDTPIQFPFEEWNDLPAAFWRYARYELQVSDGYLQRAFADIQGRKWKYRDLNPRKRWPKVLFQELRDYHKGRSTRPDPDEDQSYRYGFDGDLDPNGDLAYLRSAGIDVKPHSARLYGSKQRQGTNSCQTPISTAADFAAEGFE